MRRPAGGGGGHHYGGGDSAGGAYASTAAAPSPHMHHQQQQQSSKSGHHSINNNNNQWRWERDGSKLSSPMSPHMFNNEGQGSEASRSYYDAQRLEPRMAPERHGSHDSRSQPRGEEINIGYEENLKLQTFEGLEQKFLDDIMKLSNEQSDAEDTEIARHREKISVINGQYQEQLVALRARHASQRDEFLRRESHSRQQQYQQASMDHYPSSGRSDPQGYSSVAPPAREPQRAYAADNYDSHRERARYLGSGRNNEFEPRVQYPGGRAYDSGSRYF
ncbi:hypothetical protein ACH5RR_021251 [Cinchona calisaya]|uniref:Uncharacterized protein n=1 Tax=Cinchona calisaya TaxID=153742 RepID=A0ABD2ZJN7_9GENT